MSSTPSTRANSKIEGAEPPEARADDSGTAARPGVLKVGRHWARVGQVRDT